MNNSILQLLSLKSCLIRAWRNTLTRLHCSTFFYLHNGRRQLSWKSMCSISRTRRAFVHYLHVWHNLHRQYHLREKPLLCGEQRLRQVVQWWYQLMPIQTSSARVGTARAESCGGKCISGATLTYIVQFKYASNC